MLPGAPEALLRRTHRPHRGRSRVKAGPGSMMTTPRQPCPTHELPSSIRYSEGDLALLRLKGHHHQGTKPRRNARHGDHGTLPISQTSPPDVTDDRVVSSLWAESTNRMRKGDGDASVRGRGERGSGAAAGAAARGPRLPGDGDDDEPSQDGLAGAAGRPGGRDGRVGFSVGR